MKIYNSSVLAFDAKAKTRTAIDRAVSLTRPLLVLR